MSGRRARKEPNGAASPQRWNVPAKRCLALLALVGSVLIHWPLGVAEFTFDDRDFVQVNASIRSLAGARDALLAPFPPDQPERGLYRPLTNLSYAFDYALSGADARGFHRTNVLLYLLIVLLVQRLAFVYFASRGPAFAAALVFSLHPVHTAAVDAVAGRSELLALLFGLTSILLFLRAVRGAGAAGWALAGSLAAYAMACLSKETGAVLPGVLAFHAALYHPPRGEAERERRNRLLRSLVPFALVLVAYVCLRIGVLGRFSPEQVLLAGQPLAARLLTMGAVFFEYGRLLVFPRVLQVDFYYYDRIGVPAEPTAASLLGIVAFFAALALLVALAVRQLYGVAAGGEGRGHSPRALAVVALATFWIFLFPVSHVLDIGALMAERFLLAPSLGFVVLLVVAANEIGSRFVTDPRRRAVVAASLLGVVAVAGGWRSASRAAEWRDNLRLWQVTAGAVPDDARAQLNLGGAYFERGELDSAQSAFERARAIEPGSLDVLGNLGAVQLRRGDYEAARISYRRLVEIAPGDFAAWTNLGLAEAFLERHAAARGHYERALQLNPNYGPARDNLRESLRIIARATDFIAERRAGAASSRDPALLRSLSAACRVVGDDACAEQFEARAAGEAPEVRRAPGGAQGEER